MESNNTGVPNARDTNTANLIKSTLITLYEYHYNRDPNLSIAIIDDLAEDLYNNWSHSLMLPSDMRTYFEATLRDLKIKYTDHIH